MTDPTAYSRMTTIELASWHDGLVSALDHAGRVVQCALDALIDAHLDGHGEVVLQARQRGHEEATLEMRRIERSLASVRNEMERRRLPVQG